MFFTWLHSNVSNDNIPEIHILCEVMTQNWFQAFVELWNAHWCWNIGMDDIPCISVGSGSLKLGRGTRILPFKISAIKTSHFPNCLPICMSSSALGPKHVERTFGVWRWCLELGHCLSTKGTETSSHGGFIQDAITKRGSQLCPLQVLY